MQLAGEKIVLNEPNGEVHLDLTAVNQWAERIRAAMPFLETASLYWANDVLDEIGSEGGR
jgi:hypothetical protein